MDLYTLDAALEDAKTDVKKILRDLVPPIFIKAYMKLKKG
jgi:hypothetical protein